MTSGLGRPRAILFDLDGVLVDTTSVVAANWRRFAERSGRTIDPELLRRVQGRRTADALVAEFGLAPAEAAELASRWTEAGDLDPAQRATIVPIPGTVRFVRACARAGVPTGLVSSASEANVRFAIALAGLDGTFDVVVTAADVACGKPDPEPYLLAATRLTVRAADTVVIEDSPPGIAAGRAAGAWVVALATTFADQRELLADANLILDDLGGLDPAGLLDRSIGSVVL